MDCSIHSVTDAVQNRMGKVIILRTMPRNLQDAEVCFQCQDSFTAIGQAIFLPQQLSE